MELKNKDTTSYICAAVHSNENFCNQILEEVFKEEHRAVGRCYGVDLPKVVKNCLAAREIRDTRNLRLALLLLLAIIVSGITKDPLVITLFYPGAYLMVFSYLKRRRNVVAKHLFKPSFNIEFKTTPTWEKRLQEIDNEQKGNVIIYGDFSPFVGAGAYLSGWSFTVNINKGKKEEQKVIKPIKFDLNEIHDYISNSIIKLNLDNLIIEDNLHINGEEIRDDKRFLPDPLKRPLTLVEPQLIRDFMEKPTHNIRHYKCIRVTDWNGEIIFSVFLRFVKVGQNLFTEASYFLLTPLRDYYRQFDKILLESTSREIWFLVIESLFKSIFFWFFSPFTVLHRFNRSEQQEGQRRLNRRNIDTNPSFNYGATDSLRERVSYSEYRRYFQKLDQEMYLKIIERQIIDSIKNFLESKNIDTSDFEEARSSILNYGVVVSGGSIEAKNLAVGRNAKSMTNNNKRSVKFNLKEDSNTNDK